jgi:RNA polymerase subunit RPABC4/transcription elongation factor Spt4
MLSSYLICTTCESLFSPEFKACPVCGTLVDIGTGCRIFRILPHMVCSNCGYLIADFTDSCPVCNTPLGSHNMRKIVKVPVELEIVGINGKSIGRNQPDFG